MEKNPRNMTITLGLAMTGISGLLSLAYPAALITVGAGIAITYLGLRFKPREKADTRIQVKAATPTTSRLTKLTVALSILAILTASISSYTAYRAYAATQYSFPQGQTFSIGVAYSFASSTSNNLLLPGSTGNVTLTITSGLKTPAQVSLTFNATNPSEWGWNGNQVGGQGFCPPGPSTQQLQMSLNSQTFLPANADLSFLNGCGSVPTNAIVTVSPGTNTYMALLTVSPSASLATVFSIHWFATTA